MNERKRGKKRQLYMSGRRYSWPNPLASAEQYEKFLGLDIEGMTPLERWREIEQLKTAIAWMEDDESVLFYHPTETTTRLAWVVERIRKLIHSAVAKGVKTT